MCACVHANSYRKIYNIYIHVKLSAKPGKTSSLEITSQSVEHGRGKFSPSNADLFEVRIR